VHRDDSTQSQTQMQGEETLERPNLEQPTQIPSPPLPSDDRGAPIKSTGINGRLIFTTLAFLGVGCVGLVVIGNFALRAATDIGMAYIFSVTGLDLAAVQDDPEFAVGAFYSGLKRHDYEYARSFLAPELADKYPPSELRARWEALEKARGQISLNMDFSTLDVWSTTASMTTSLIPTKGDAFKVKLEMVRTIEMVRTSDTWKITNGSPALIPQP
jgi:hypothetical protein